MKLEHTSQLPELAQDIDPNAHTTYRKILDLRMNF
jgi:hypothetical protein